MSTHKKLFFGAGKVSDHHSYISIHISNRKLSGGGGDGVFALIFLLQTLTLHHSV